MREILFRALPHDSAEFVFGYFVKHYTGHSFIVSLDGTNTCIVREETLGQFTGMLDCKGTKIFEGDIIKWSTTRYQSCYEGHDPDKAKELITIEWRSPVEYEDDGFVVTESFDLDQKNNCCLAGVEKPEVIGHIYG